MRCRLWEIGECVREREGEIKKEAAAYYFRFESCLLVLSMAGRGVYIDGTKNFPMLLLSRKSFRRHFYNKGVPVPFILCITINPPLCSPSISGYVCQSSYILAGYTHPSSVIDNDL